jgi:hypothetical protein
MRLTSLPYHGFESMLPQQALEPGGAQEVLVLRLEPE